MSDPIFEDNVALYLVADHLDAVLAAGEDLLKLSVDLESAPWDDKAHSGWQKLRIMVGRARALEMSLVTRALQARTRLRDLSPSDPSIGRLIALYVAGTGGLTGAAKELADPTLAEFDEGGDPLAYLRSRGLVSSDAASIDTTATLAISEDMLIAHSMALGPLLDMTAGLLDVLDTAYGLYEREPVNGKAVAATPSEAPATGPANTAASA